MSLQMNHLIGEGKISIKSNMFSMHGQQIIRSLRPKNIPHRTYMSKDRIVSKGIFKSSNLLKMEL